MQREFFRKRKSPKWKKLKAKFKKEKRKSIKQFYSEFVTDLKKSNPGKWFTMAKRIGALDQMSMVKLKLNPCNICLMLNVRSRLQNILLRYLMNTPQ